VADVTRTRATREIISSGWPKAPGPNGNGSNGNGRRKRFGGERRFSRDTYRIATWVLLAAVVMIFVAMGSAYIVLSGDAQWQPVRMPRTFLLSTGLILISSVTMEAARRQLHREHHRQYERWLLATLLLGGAFVCSQLVGWKHLIGEGAYLSGNPHSSFFYLFTGAHGVHLLGGMAALSYLALRARKLVFGVSGEKKVAAADAVSLYWHFMDGLWVALFLLLLLWK
jgi:cytochrome c oxidase subunit III